MEVIEVKGMQVDVNELAFIMKNKRPGMFTTVANRLNQKGIPATRHSVANEVTKIKDEYKDEIIQEVREVFTFMTGLTYEKPGSNN